MYYIYYKSYFLYSITIKYASLSSIFPDAKAEYLLTIILTNNNDIHKCVTQVLKDYPPSNITSTTTTSSLVIIVCPTMDKRRRERFTHDV